jgi:hypothetical protein
MSGATEIRFYVGESLPGEFEDVESGTFVGCTFQEIRSELETIYEFNEPFQVFVNGELASRKFHHLDYGDEVRILLYPGREPVNDGIGGDSHCVPSAESPMQVDLQTNEVTIKGGKTYPLDSILAAIVAELVKAKGKILSRNEMRARNAKLKDYTHLEREIEKLPPAIFDLIEPVKGRGYCIPWE